MTAYEHMEMFCKIKGVPWDNMPDIIDRNLKSVKLFDERFLFVGTFSGGMKWRLSVAISCIGDP